MNAASVITDCILNKYVVCRGRASRGEFFSYFIFFVLFCALWGSLLDLIIDFSHDLNLLDFVLLYVPFFLLPPLVSVSVRRFHDCSKSGWLVILLCIPLINLYGFYLLCRPGTGGSNRFGPQPPKTPILFKA